METLERWITFLVNIWPLLLIVFGLVYPFIPGPVRAWLLAQKAKAASETDMNDTILLLDTLWRGFQDARKEGMSQQAAITKALVYVATNRSGLVAKLGARQEVMAQMLNSKIKDHEDALSALVPTSTSAVVAGAIAALKAPNE